MEVILQEKIRNLGDLGQKVNVKPGYARNFLIPQGKALQATPENLKAFEARRAELEKNAAERLQQAQDKAQKLVALDITIASNAGDGGKLFGSIGTRDIADAIVAKGVEIGKHEVRMPHGVIREIGEFPVGVHLHTDVDVEINVKVIAE